LNTGAGGENAESKRNPARSSAPSPLREPQRGSAYQPRVAPVPSRPPAPPWVTTPKNYPQPQRGCVTLPNHKLKALSRLDTRDKSLPTSKAPREDSAKCVEHAEVLIRIGLEGLFVGTRGDPRNLLGELG
jgi:hypothetical protein